MPSSPIVKKAKSASSKKSTKLDSETKRQRREVIEKRILKLESKLNKDRTLLLRYTDTTTEPASVSQEEGLAQE